MKDKEGKTIFDAIREHTQNHISKEAQRELAYIPQIADADLVEYPGLLAGNDPWIGDQDIVKYQLEENFVFVGTSLFGGLKYACALCKNREIVPQLIIVDNSRQVISCWIKLKEFFSTTSNSQSSFQERLDQFLNFLLDDIYDLVRDNGFADYTYFLKFFKQYDFDYIQNVIPKAIILKQSWGDKKTFQAIKTAFSETKIVAYPSNIISYVDTKEIKMDILHCINLLNPILCIYSDLHGIPGQKKPKNIMLATAPFTVNEIASSLGILVPDELLEDDAQISTDNPLIRKT